MQANFIQSGGGYSQVRYSENSGVDKTELVHLLIVGFGQSMCLTSIYTHIDMYFFLNELHK